MPTATPPEAGELIAALARGEVRSIDAVRDQISRLQRVHAAANCVAAWNDEAESEASELDQRYAAAGPIGPLHGVPITVKDWIDVAGMPCSGGEVAHQGRMPERDATVVARLRAAGAIVIAKTTVQVDSELFGPVLHPLDPTRSPGGSSSGEAAAIGGGGSILGIGSDSGGSLRVPAAWCGITTLKPSAGRVPTTGHFPRIGEHMDGRTQTGPFATSVHLLRQVLPIIAGPDGVDAGVAPVPLGDSEAVAVADLRVGWCTGDDTYTPDAHVRAAVERAASMLEGLGAHGIGEIPQHLDEALDVTLEYWKRASGHLSGWDVEAHLAAWDRYASRMLRTQADVDVVVMPVTHSVAPLHRPMAPLDYIFTMPASLTGAPVVVFPMGQDSGLPIAVQVVAHRWRDDIALRAAEAIEAAVSRQH